ncbi:MULTISPECIES: DNA/RNA non-specific endonuclease [unclassified Bradyrhizobium]|uniref:DNA/RNA non-specific endonuclease n=1 Tax=unclassified Bradyrhizobium TaxID=2631580 RepID=UPI001FFA704A|nr:MULTISPECIES: DNA/RNA non-specific endonuclease [unclassified Bradyrhizobium]MCK1713031.1 DNA/RNA non-specific endonuclease [Bradyrhizobium sp. 143]MCK1724626.1 DNA/RNA non-specific endonuclease [Bradyrhizobium sp. 142]
MFIKPSLIAGSERRFKQAEFSPDALNRKLGDGPIEMTVEKKRLRQRQLFAETRDVQAAEIGLERIIEGNDLDSINYLAKGTAASRPVCRIQLRDLKSNLIGYGSGFLIGPGLLLTNHHVFGKPADAANSIADFNYELDISGEERVPVRFAFEPGKFFYTNDGLDFSIVAVAPTSLSGSGRLVDWGWLPLSGAAGKADPGEYLTIVQHPSGQMKQVCVRENKLLKYVGDFLWYKTDTTAGSSGSPAFNRFWQVVALHHSGVPRKDAQGRTLTKDGKVWDASMDETSIDWIANEGIRISSIVADLKIAVGSHPFIRPVLDEEEPPTRHEVERVLPPAAATPYGANVWVEQSVDGTSLVVPIRVPLPMFRKELPMAALAPVPSPAGSNGGASNGGMQNGSMPLIAPPAGLLPRISAKNGLPMEAVHIDQATLKSRPGYKANFLGSGKFSVALPKIPASLKSRVAMLKGRSKQSELNYFNYSVVMNKERRLAFFSCVNIDGGKQQDVGKREGDSWLRDPRIDDDAQIGDEFYRKQATFEADRSKNPFDRGHLVRRLDATWGDTVAEAKQHGDDSFHFTNCSPQFFSFNQGKQLWAGLEDYTRDVLLDGEEKGIVMNGPVFDGPDADGSDLPNPAGRPHTDPSFGGVQIPKYFWKILVRRDDGGLKAAAFLMSQTKLVMEIDRIQEADLLKRMSEEDVSVFQVSIADLAKLTKLDFGNLADADSHEATSVGPRRIESYEDIRI